MALSAATLLLQLFNRILRITPEKQLRKLRTQLEEKEAEVESLRRVIVDLESQIEDRDNEAAAKSTASEVSEVR